MSFSRTINNWTFFYLESYGYTHYQPKLSKSSRDWMREHLHDPYVKKAQKDGYRARAAYKLLEMQEKYKMIKPGMTVVDLVQLPGVGHKLQVSLVGDKGLLIASDISTNGCIT